MEDIRKLLYSLNPWWVRPYTPEDLFLRGRYLISLKKLLQLPHIVVLAGARRAGKTSMLKILIGDLLANAQKDPLDILYISFDDPVLGTYISQKNILQHILEEYELIRRSEINKNTLLIIDEIQSLPGWQGWLKKYYDQHKYKFIVSGSSAALLKGRFTELTGRSVSMEITPLDFREIVEMKLSLSIPFLKDWTYEEFKTLNDLLLPHRKRIKILFEEYKENGGFPEILAQTDTEIRKTILRNYFDQILYRDIVRVHRIKEVGVLESLTLYLMQNVSQKFSLHNTARSIEANVEIVRTFLSYLAQSYLFYVVTYYGSSLKTTLKKMKKIYFIDMGLRHSVVGHKGEDEGMVVENIVFLALRKNFDSVSYWHDRAKNELDFAARRKNNLYGFEVKYSGSDLKASDLKGLLRFLEAKELREGFVLTKDTFEEKLIQEKRILLLPVWLFLLASQES